MKYEILIKSNRNKIFLCDITSTYDLQPFNHQMLGLSHLRNSTRYNWKSTIKTRVMQFCPTGDATSI